MHMGHVCVVRRNVNSRTDALCVTRREERTCGEGFEMLRGT